MTRVSVLFLLIGFGAGLLVGLFFSESEPARVHRPGPSPVEAPRARAAALAEPEPVPVEPVSDSPEPATVEEGYGVLEVEVPLEEVSSFGLVGRRITGKPRIEEFEPEEGESIARVEVLAGDYVLRWQGESDAGERELPVRIVARCVTRVALAQVAAAPYSAPSGGLGMFVVEVLDIEGKRVPDACVELCGIGMLGEEEEVIDCNASGEARVLVMPGSYRLEIGAQSRSARVEAGEIKTVVFAYRGEGEVRYRNGAGSISLRRLDRGSGGRYARHGRDRLLYVDPGDYQVVWSAMLLGTVHVAPGRLSQVDLAIPRGSVELRIRFDADVVEGAYVSVRYHLEAIESGLMIAHGSEWSLSFPSGGEAVHRSSIGGLHPGRYRLTTWGRKIEKRVWQFDVVEPPAVLEIHLRAKS